MQAVVAQLKDSYAGIPQGVRQFLLKAITLFILWKLLYHGLLLEGRVLDAPLTEANAQSTAWVYKQLHPKSTVGITHYNSYKFYKEGIPHTALVRDGQKVVGVTDGCNGLEIFVLYAGFLFCLPGSWQRRLLFVAGGLVFFYGLNVARVVALALLHEHYQSYFDIAHHYVFKLIVYSLVFGAWVWFAQKSPFAEQHG